MTISLTCSCGRQLQIGEEHAGKKGVCPICGRDLDIPIEGIPIPLASPVAPEVDPQPPPATPLPAEPARQDPLNFLKPGEVVRPSSLPRRRDWLHSWGAGITLLIVVAALGGLLIGLPLVRNLNRDQLGGQAQRIRVSRGEEIWYERGITMEEARQVGRILQELTYFDGQGDKSIRLSQDDNVIHVTIYVVDEVFNDAEFLDGFRHLAQRFSQEVFGNRAVLLDLHDTLGFPRKTIRS